MNEEKEMHENPFMKDFITVGELRKMLKGRKDTEFITVKVIYDKEADYHKPLWLEDSTAVGFWELRCN